MSKQPQLSVPVDLELLARVKSAAEREQRSVANYVRMLIEQALRQRGEAA